MSHLLSGAGLALFRGDRCLFRDLDFALESGELLLLEGRNGSGKTSLLKVILGLLAPESGEVRWDGRPTIAERQAFHGALAWMAHRVGLKGDLSLVENLAFEARLRPQSTRDLDHVLERLGIERLKPLPLRLLSAGQQRRVALARLLLAGVPLWLMDEPFTNLDRDGRTLVVRLVREHLNRGGMAVMTAHQDVEIDAPVKRLVLS